jgi:hypothetical protein
VYEHNTHVCFKPSETYYVVTSLDYVNKKRQQKKVETLTEAFILADKYYDERKDEILSTVRGLEESDLWRQMEAEDAAEAERMNID